MTAGITLRLAKYPGRNWEREPVAPAGKPGQSGEVSRKELRVVYTVNQSSDVSKKYPGRNWESYGRRIRFSVVAKYPGRNWEFSRRGSHRTGSRRSIQEGIERMLAPPGFSTGLQVKYPGRNWELVPSATDLNVSITKYPGRNWETVRRVGERAPIVSEVSRKELREVASSQGLDSLFSHKKYPGRNWEPAAFSTTQSHIFTKYPGRNWEHPCSTSMHLFMHSWSIQEGIESAH